MMKVFLSMAAAALMLAAPALAQSYPSKAITMVVPYSAGGSTDVLGRFYADGLSKLLGQPVVVENRAGLSIIGTAVAARAPADGYTILMGNGGTHALNMVMYKTPGYDAEKDFDPVGKVAHGALVIAVNADTNIKSMQELIQRSQSEVINVALPSVASNIINQLLVREGAKLHPIPYKGSADAMNALLGGHVHAIIETAGVAQPHIESGKLVGLGVTSSTESDVLPGIPTVKSQGLNFERLSWFGFFVPKGTSPQVIGTLNAALKTFQMDPATKQKLVSLGFDFVEVGEPEELSAFARKDLENLKQIAADANIVAQ